MFNMMCDVNICGCGESIQFGSFGLRGVVSHTPKALGRDTRQVHRELTAQLGQLQGRGGVKGHHNTLRGYVTTVEHFNNQRVGRLSM